MPTYDPRQFIQPVPQVTDPAFVPPPQQVTQPAVVPPAPPLKLWEYDHEPRPWGIHTGSDPYVKPPYYKAQYREGDYDPRGIVQENAVKREQMILDWKFKQLDEQLERQKRMRQRQRIFGGP